MPLTMLFIGGTGTISSAVTALSVERGNDVTLLNRGMSGPAVDVRQLVGDARDAASIESAVGSLEFDVVVNFRSYQPAEARSDVRIFEGRTGQYVYISSASAYQKPVARLPITESTPLRNPFWEYSRNKAASEQLLTDAYRDSGFPVTIVRPSHTYSNQSLPLLGGWTTIDRMLRGLPVVVHGDGTSLWTLTHHTDFARAFVGLLGHPGTIGDSFHITSDEALTWDAIATTMGRAFGVTANIVHAASDDIARAIPEWKDGLIGDRSHSLVFDNTKIKSIVPGWRATVPFWQGARGIAEWYDTHREHQQVDGSLDAKLDAIVSSRA